MPQPNHLELVRPPAAPRVPKRSIEVSLDDLESIAFDAAVDGVIAEIWRPEGSGWRRLEVSGQRYHAWQNAVGTAVPR